MTPNPQDSAVALEVERAEFEVWTRTREGHPFAGQFANLMWAAWQARASLSTSKQAGAAHSQLMKFYGVDSVDALVAAQADHITKLQDRLPRNTAFTVQRVREG